MCVYNIYRKKCVYIYINILHIYVYIYTYIDCSKPATRLTQPQESDPRLGFLKIWFCGKKSLKTQTNMDFDLCSSSLLRIGPFDSFL